MAKTQFSVSGLKCDIHFKIKSGVLDAQYPSNLCDGPTKSITSGK